MKGVAIITIGLTLVGIGMLFVTFLSYQNTSFFLAESLKTEGTVVKLAQSATDDSTTYSPVIRFISKNGKTIEFDSHAGNNPPKYSVGQSVKVLYSPTEPQNAKINDFFFLWGFSIMSGVMGLAFIIGAGILLAVTLKDKKNESPRKNTALSVNGRNPCSTIRIYKIRRPILAIMCIYDVKDETDQTVFRLCRKLRFWASDFTVRDRSGKIQFSVREKFLTLSPTFIITQDKTQAAIVRRTEIKQGQHEKFVIELMSGILMEATVNSETRSVTIQGKSYIADIRQKSSMSTQVFTMTMVCTADAAFILAILMSIVYHDSITFPDSIGDADI